VTLVRDQRSYHLDLSDPAAPWTASPIRSGDQIIIGRKSNLFFGMILPLVTASAAVASLISVYGTTDRHSVKAGAEWSSPIARARRAAHPS